MHITTPFPLLEWRHRPILLFMKSLSVIWNCYLERYQTEVRRRECAGPSEWLDCWRDTTFWIGPNCFSVILPVLIQYTRPISLKLVASRPSPIYSRPTRRPCPWRRPRRLHLQRRFPPKNISPYGGPQRLKDALTYTSIINPSFHAHLTEVIRRIIKSLSC